MIVRNCFLGLGSALIGFAFMAGSCGNTRHLTYLQGQFDTAKLSQVNAIEPIIRKGDLLSIIVFSDNPAATRIYNQSLIAVSGSSSSSSSASEGGTSPSAPGYQVDYNGNIMFQGLGLLHVEGLTKEQLKDTLDSRLDSLLVHPYFNVSFLNYKFTMLGEVNKPGVISIPGEKINLLEALSLAGDMTFYGRRDNVLIIRETNGHRDFARLDITKPDIMASPYYYLQQNDIVYIEATKQKVSNTDQTFLRALTVVSVLVSTFAILYSIFK